MKRVDYAHPRKASAVFSVGRVAADGRLRETFLAAGTAALAVAAVAWIESARYMMAAQAADAMAARFARVEDRAVHVRALAHEVARLEAIGTRAAQLRASGPQTANSIAALGNRLPGDVWLNSLRRSAGTIALEGHGARVAAIPNALLALTALPDSRPRLVSVAADNARGGITYAITLHAGT